MNGIFQIAERLRNTAMAIVCSPRIFSYLPGYFSGGTPINRGHFTVDTNLIELRNRRRYLADDDIHASNEKNVKTQQDMS